MLMPPLATRELFWVLTEWLFLVEKVQGGLSDDVRQGGRPRNGAAVPGSGVEVRVLGEPGDGLMRRPLPGQCAESWWKESQT